jgi:hypothetical protein
MPFMAERMLMLGLKSFQSTSRLDLQRLGMVLALMALLLVNSNTFAQEGQICVRAFDDRNANAVYDPGEPLITRGISANLLDAENLIVQSGLLEDSPQATRGILCFQELSAGQYTLQVASADYSATTTDTFVTAVTNTSIPQVFDYGAQIIVLDGADEAGDANQLSDEQVRTLLERIFFASIGAIIVIGAMIVLGTLIYFLFLRSKPQRYAPPPDSIYAPPATGNMPPATGSMPPAQSTAEHHAPDMRSSHASVGGYRSSAPDKTPTPPPASIPPVPPVSVSSVPAPTTTTAPDDSDIPNDDMPDLPDWDDMPVQTSDASAGFGTPNDSNMPAMPDWDDAPDNTLDEAFGNAPNSLDIPETPPKKDDSKGFNPFDDTGSFKI